MPVKVYLGNKVSKISKSISKQLRERMAEAHSAQSYSRETLLPTFLGLLTWVMAVALGLGVSNVMCGPGDV